MRLSRILPPVVGFATVVLALVIVEILLRLNILNPFVIPLPSTVFGSFGRLFAEEQLLERLMMTGGEALAASVLVAVVGVALGVLLYKVRVLALATEPWVAGVAAAPVVLAYPLFLVIFGRSTATVVAMGFVAGLARSSSKRWKG